MNRTLPPDDPSPSNESVSAEASEETDVPDATNTCDETDPASVELLPSRAAAFGQFDEHVARPVVAGMVERDVDGIVSAQTQCYLAHASGHARSGRLCQRRQRLRRLSCLPQERPQCLAGHPTVSSGRRAAVRNRHRAAWRVSVTNVCRGSGKRGLRQDLACRGSLVTVTVSPLMSASVSQRTGTPSTAVGLSPKVSANARLRWAESAKPAW